MNDKSNNDCYYFVTSTCNQGDNCPFRHCLEALGPNKPVCKYWLRHDCTRKNCPYRHMNSKRDRGNIPCYYENQRSGCTKVHCVYQHRKPRISLKNAISQNDISVILPVKNLSRPGRRMSTESEPATMRDGAGTSGTSSDLSDFDSENEEAVLRQASVELMIKEYTKQQLKVREASHVGNLGGSYLLEAPKVSQKPYLATPSQPGHCQDRLKPNYLLNPPLVPAGRKNQIPIQRGNLLPLQLPQSVRPMTSNDQFFFQGANLQQIIPIQPLPVVNANNLVSANNKAKKKVEKEKNIGRRHRVPKTESTTSFETTDEIQVHANLPSKVDHRERNGHSVLQVTNSQADNMLSQSDFSLTGGTAIKETLPSKAYEENIKALSRHFNGKCKIPSEKQKTQRSGQKKGAQGKQTGKTP